MASRAFIGLGSNVGNRLGFLQAAVRALCRHHVLLRASSVYETEPVGYREQGWFLNAAIEIATTATPRELHATLKRVEAVVGRTPERRWGPREIDLDLLLFDDVSVADERLTIPHPRLHERRFVLVPLAEIAPDRVHPTLGRSMRALLEQLGDPSVVRQAYSPEVLGAFVSSCADDSKLGSMADAPQPKK